MSKKELSAKKRIIVIFLLILLGFMLLLITPSVSLFVSDYVQKIQSDNLNISTFKKNKDTFEILKEYIFQSADKSKAVEIYLDFGSDPYINYYDEFDHISNSSDKIPKDIQKACNQIEEVYKKNGIYFSYIDYNKQNKRIKFGFEGNGNAIIYSLDGQDPEYMNSANYKENFVCKKITHVWYYFRAT